MAWRFSRAWRSAMPSNSRFFAPASTFPASKPFSSTRAAFQGISAPRYR